MNFAVRRVYRQDAVVAVSVVRPPPPEPDIVPPPSPEPIEPVLRSPVADSDPDDASSDSDFQSDVSAASSASEDDGGQRATARQLVRKTARHDAARAVRRAERRRGNVEDARAYARACKVSHKAHLGRLRRQERQRVASEPAPVVVRRTYRTRSVCRLVANPDCPDFW
jgi:hypothetical protein